jgi:hypothetical protein
MIFRSLTYKEILDFNWGFYPLNITKDSTKWDIINFVNKHNKDTGEIDETYNQPVYTNEICTEIIIELKNGTKQFSRYNHIFKRDRVVIEFDNKFVPFSVAKNKIKKIYFMDNINIHSSLHQFWEEVDRGGGLTAQYRGVELYKHIDKTRELIMNSLINADTDDVLYQVLMNYHKGVKFPKTWLKLAVQQVFNMNIHKFMLVYTKDDVETLMKVYKQWLHEELKHIENRKE